MARTKQTARKRAAQEDNDSAGDEPLNKKTKQQFSLDTEPKSDDEGNPYWSISIRRRLQVSDFKGTTMVSIREYYEKDGKTLPGKGISLPVEQFSAICELLPQVESLVRAKGLDISRPQYIDKMGDTSVKPVRKHGERVADDDDGENDGNEPNIKQAQSTEGKFDKSKPKANHEATSEEDD